MTDSPVNVRLTISIATKDRPQVLEETLRRIHAFGLGSCELIVCDDGSSPALQPPSLGLFPNGRLLRNPKPMGQALARNQIASAASRPFILQLDDDSYPVAGSVERLLSTARERDDWLAMALPLEEPTRGCVALVPQGPMPDLRGFVGCAALIHKAVFLQLGGYADWIGGMVEEDELTIRAFVRGYHVRANGDLRIQHDVTPMARHLRGMEYRCHRNWTTTWLRHAPMPYALIRVVRLFGAAVLKLVYSGHIAALKGFADAMWQWRITLAARSPMPSYSYIAYVRLPHALQVLSTKP